MNNVHKVILFQVFLSDTVISFQYFYLIFTQLYIFKYSYHLEIIITKLSRFKYFYLIRMFLYSYLILIMFIKFKITSRIHNYCW